MDAKTEESDLSPFSLGSLYACTLLDTYHFVGFCRADETNGKSFKKDACSVRTILTFEVCVT